MKQTLLNFSKLRWPYRQDLAFSLLAILTLVAPLAFTLKTYENFETIKFCLLLVLSGLALFAFLSSYAKTGEIRLYLSKPFVLALAAFLVFGGLSSFLHPGSAASFFGLYTRYTGGLLFYLVLALLILLLSATFSREKYFFLLKLLVFEAFLAAVYSLLQSVEIGYYFGVDAGVLNKGPSFLGNPNFTSFFLVVALPLALFFCIRAKSVLAKVYYATVLFVTLWALVVLTSRGALLALALGLIILSLLWFTKQHSRKHAILSLAAIVAGGILLSLFLPLARPQVLKQTLQLRDDNINLRFYVWDLAAQAVLAHPVLGLGLGNFLEYYELNRGEHLADQLEAFDDPHNLFLFQASTGGLGFVLSFLALIFFAGYAFIQGFRASDDPMLGALAVSLVVWSIAASFTPVPVAAFIFLAVLLAGQALVVSQPLVLRIPKILGVCLKILGVGLAIYGLLFIISEHVFFQAYQAYYSRQYEKARNFSKWAETICPCNGLYGLYNLGSRIKLEKDSPQVLKDLEIFSQNQLMRPRLRAANLYFLLYLETKNYRHAETAITYLTEILGRNPRHSERHARVGFYYFEAGQVEVSMLYINNALSLNPKFFPAWLLKAKLHQIRGEKQPMLYSLKQVQKQFPQDLYLRKLIFDAEQQADIKGLPIVVGANYDRLE